MQLPEEPNPHEVSVKVRGNDVSPVLLKPLISKFGGSCTIHFKDKYTEVTCYDTDVRVTREQLKEALRNCELTVIEEEDE